MSLLYVALIRKINLQCEDNTDIFDIAFAKGTSVAEAEKKIINMDWPEPWYDKKKGSKTVLVQIWQWTDTISGKHMKMARDAAEMQEFKALTAHIQEKATKPVRRRRKAPETAPKRPQKAAKPRRRVRKL
jgi:TfoX/Sxy family transcriptional regulator of competence genes